MAKKPDKPSHNQRSVGNFDLKFGIRLRGYRMDREMSQEDLATLLNVSFQQVQKYEKGTNRVSLARFVELCDIFDVSAQDFLGDTLKNSKIAAKDPPKPVNAETFKMAQALASLDDDLKPAFRNLINTIIRNGHAGAG